jgi:integrase
MRGVGSLFRFKYAPRGMTYAQAKSAGVLKESAVWWIGFPCRGTCGRADCRGRHSESTKTDNRREAERLLRQKLGQVGLGKLVTAEAEKTTFTDLEKLIVTDYSINARKSSERLKYSLNHLRAFFGAYRALAITGERIREYVKERQQAGAANGTIKCELACLKRMFALGLEVGKVSVVLTFPRIKGSSPRKGFFEAPELDAVLGHLPDDLRPPVQFAAWTGWRKSEVLGLTWDRVDFVHGEVRLEIGTTKNDEARVFPFSALPALADLIYRQRERTSALEKERGITIAHVFHRNGRPIRDMYKKWRLACRAAKVSGRRIHDLRRTAIRALERASVPRSVATKLTGHKTESVYRHYAIVSKADLTEGVSKLARLHDLLDGKPQRTLPSRT